uniref:Exocyst complex component SEC3A-like protein n=1 Tax=Rhizophora mucronata TaxID=61149 RepID=A0A2P2MS91_RHIMU
MIRPLQLSSLRKVTLVTYHEIHQTSKVVSQELRSCPDKCSF